MATENPEEEKKNHIAIKSSLNAILRPEHANEVRRILFDRSVEMTKISSLASLLVLYKVNTAYDRGHANFFLAPDGKNRIYECFDAVTQEHIDKLPQRFKNTMEWIHRNEPVQFEWPRKHCLGNAFQYFREQYVTNLKTNLNTHGEKHLKDFLRIRCFQWNLRNLGMTFDGTDLRNVLKNIIKDQDWTDGDALRQQKVNVLLLELADIGFPADTNLKQYIREHWFESMLPFINIQREIEQFLIEYADNFEQWRAFNKDRKGNEKPTVPRPPTVRNFSVLPLCNFHLKHIRIDTKDCYWLTSKCGAKMETFLNDKTGNFNKVKEGHYTNKKLSKEEKAERAAELFDFLFDMNKIRRNGKHAKRFYGQIVTDGVSASVIYTKQPRQSIFSSMWIIMTMWIMGLFVNEIGIDPGDKTWLAGVRREIRTRIEVSDENIFESIYPNTHLLIYGFFYRRSSKFHRLASIGEPNKGEEKRK